VTEDQKANESHPLRVTIRPAFEAGRHRVRVVDLFSGCGGLTLGVAQAAQAVDAGLDVRLAVDLDDIATKVYRHNFPKARAVTGRVESYFDGALDRGRTETEANTKKRCGAVDILIGGPPCQGHSDLNNHTRRNDPKNALYVRMARAAEVLKPSVVMVENVPAVRHDKSDALGLTTAHLALSGYAVAHRVVELRQLGVAQTRRRHVLLASRIAAVDPIQVLTELGKVRNQRSTDLEWAIGDLVAGPSSSEFDTPPRASETNQKRMAYLLEHGLYDLPNSQRPPCHQDEHSYKSMYGRLRWDAPAQTITSGFGSIGQGRYMHPDVPRALTPHEAARIQGIPDYFQFAATSRRTSLATIIGNAVPPQLSKEIFAAVLPLLSLPVAK